MTGVWQGVAPNRALTCCRFLCVVLVSLGCSWAATTLYGECFKRGRMSQIDEEGATGELAKQWEAQRSELISQIEDLQAQVSSLRGDWGLGKRRPVERCRTVCVRSL